MAGGQDVLKVSSHPSSGLAKPVKGAVFEPSSLGVTPWQVPRVPRAFLPGPGGQSGTAALLLWPTHRWAFGGNPFAILQNVFVALLRFVVVNISFSKLMSTNKPPGYFHLALGERSGLPCDKKPKASSLFSCSELHGMCMRPELVLL